MDPENPESPLEYAEFGDWYDEYRRAVLEPSLAAASDALDAALVDQLTDRDLARIRHAAGRVKSKRRTWRKIHQPRYADRIRTVADIPTVIDDLVGLRITCTNLRDIDMVQSALDTLPRTPGKNLWLDPSSERDYVVAPKESGYRGWHVNLGIGDQAAGKRSPIMCELQIRTLLQDSWGELTHEDTYSKDGELPPLVEVLSKRMADLFSTLDDIAEDLRTELDRIDDALVSESSLAPSEYLGSIESEPVVPSSALASDAAALLIERWQAIDRPTDMGSLAWALQREFGAEISDDWFGHGSFKRFLRSAVPDGEISAGGKPYLLPLEDRTSAQADDEDSSVPAPALQLRRIDRGFPLLDGEQWKQLYDPLADAWKKLGHRNQTSRALHELTRSARDGAEAAGIPIARRHFDHVARTILASDGVTGEPLEAAEIGRLFVGLTLERMIDLRILGRDDHDEMAHVSRWLAPRHPSRRPSS